MSVNFPAEVKEEDVEYIGEGEVELLPYEQHTLLDTMTDDVLFITARFAVIRLSFIKHLEG